ncbi:MAG: hypothetical protein C5B49_02755 [Bdellovibrio sp.]|nr:MAG: hypothetical protein C5B49_02755 [Bdellovibrio sp.]
MIDREQRAYLNFLGEHVETLTVQRDQRDQIAHRIRELEQANVHLTAECAALRNELGRKKYRIMNSIDRRISGFPALRTFLFKVVQWLTRHR